MSNIQSQEYQEFLQSIKNRVRQVQIKASLKVNSELLQFYWELGADIVAKQKDTHWGSGFLTQMSQDLSKEFPTMKGFSKRNLELIRKWYLFYSQDDAIAKQVVSQLVEIPWGHNIAIIQKSKSIKEAIFYIQKTKESSYSRNLLIHQIERV